MNKQKSPADLEWERELKRLNLEVKNEYFNRHPGKTLNEFTEKNKRKRITACRPG